MFKMILTIKLFTGKRAPQHGTGTPKLEDLLVNYEYVDIDIPPNATFDDVILKCAAVCNILPMYLPLFALWNPVNQSWAKLSATVETSNVLCDSSLNSPENLSSCLEFRIRFLVKTEQQVSGNQKNIARRWCLPGDDPKPFIPDSIVTYLFHQRREDFIQDKIELKVEAENDKENNLIAAMLGVAVLDMICLSRETNSKLKTISQKIKFKSLLPKSGREHLSSPQMNFWNRSRVKRKFRHYLKYFARTAQRWQSMGFSVPYYQRKYLLNLELLSVSYGVEEYSFQTKSSNTPMKCSIRVSADAGIVVHSNESSGFSEDWCSFPELTDMSLQVRRGCDSTMCMVILSKLNGSVARFALDSVSSGENLASCISGYYHLLVDSHHYLCREISSPSLVKKLKLGCHGPISCAFAEEILRERYEEGFLKVGDCVIRQSQEAYNEYFANTVCDVNPLKIKNFKLDCDASGKLGLYGLDNSHKYDSLGELLDACKGGMYENGPIPFNTDQIVFPKSKMKTNLIVRLCSSLDNTNVNANDLKIEPRTTIYARRDYKAIKDLGHGSFTTVMLYARRDAPNQFIVLKTVFELDDLAHRAHIEESFQETMTMLTRLSHGHIVQHLGILGLNKMVVLEHVKEHSITSYLQQNHTDLKSSQSMEWSTWFLTVVWQIAHACNYLENLNFSHGNLCGKNVLLNVATPQPHIKLADPGVKTSKGRDDSLVGKPILTAPWLAIEFCAMKRAPSYRSYPTIEGDKWSFATTVCEILNWGKIDVEPMDAYALTPKMKLKYDCGEVLEIPELIKANEELYLLITQCWRKQSDKRPSFQKIIRELSSTLSSDYILPAMLPRKSQNSYRESFPCIDSFQPDLPTYEDEKLTFITCLGEGHFGSVDLFIYDRQKNGRKEQVAVKSLKRSSNKPQSIIDFKNEIETMKKLNNKYVVQLRGISLPSGRIVMEYLPNGSLADLLKKKRIHRLPLKHLLQFSSQIAQGMIALQKKRLIHRDLALRNILLAEDTLNNQLHIKISDFGLSRILNEDSNLYLGNLEEFPVHWYAPECLCIDRKKAFRFESDVWSFGITIWEMFSYGEKPTYPPLEPVTEARFLIPLHTHLKNGNRLAQTQYCPKSVYNLMLRCWQYEPTERISFEELQSEFDILILKAD